MTMSVDPRSMASGSEPGDPVGPEARLPGLARQSSRLSELPTARPFPAADGESLDARRRYLHALGGHAKLLARTAGRTLNRDERRLLKHYETLLANPQELK